MQFFFYGTEPLEADALCAHLVTCGMCTNSVLGVDLIKETLDLCSDISHFVAVNQLYRFGSQTPRRCVT